MNPDFVILMCSILCSAFFAGSETAFTVAGKLPLEVLSRHGRRGAISASKMWSNPDRLFTITLVGNNLVNVIYSSFAALWLKSIGLPIEVILLISPVIVLIFGEILPKAFARELPYMWAMATAKPLWLIYYMLYPLFLLALWSSKLVLAIQGRPSRDGRQHAIHLSDLTAIWGEMHRAGVVDKVRADLIEGVVELREIHMRMVMTPRIEIVALPLSATIAEAEALVRSSGYTRIPIYDQNIDNIMGVLNARDLLNSPEELTQIVRPVAFVPEQKPPGELISALKSVDSKMAVVVDEYGGTAGIVTLEDILETIVGDIRDEYDHPEERYVQLSDSALMVGGRASLEVLRDRWDLDLPEGEYESVGGLLIQQLGKIPVTGETHKIGNLELRVVNADDRRVKRVIIKLVNGVLPSETDE